MLRLTKNLKKSICPTELPKHLPKFRHIPKVPLSGGTTKDDHIILHPDIFAIEHPDIRLLKQAVTWQETYKLVDMTHRVWRLENFGSKNKPWRLNSGRTRRRDERGPSSLLGTTKGNFSGPWSMWSEFSEDKQCEALIAALTVRYAQGDLVIFDGDRLLEREDKSNKDYVLTIVGDLLVPKKLYIPIQIQQRPTSHRPQRPHHPKPRQTPHPPLRHPQNPTKITRLADALPYRRIRKF